MVHFRFEHEFDVEPKTFFEIFFSEPYSVELYDALKIGGRKVLESTDDGKVMRRAQRLTPTVNMPSVIAKVIPDQTYTERNVFYRAENKMDVVIEPAALASKFDLKGKFTVTPVGEGRCKRVFEGDVKVSIMIIGGQIEKFMVEQMRTSYDLASDVTRKYIAKWKAAQPKA